MCSKDGSIDVYMWTLKQPDGRDVSAASGYSAELFIEHSLFINDAAIKARSFI